MWRTSKIWTKLVLWATIKFKLISTPALSMQTYHSHTSLCNNVPLAPRCTDPSPKLIANSWVCKRFSPSARDDCQCTGCARSHWQPGKHHVKHKQHGCLPPWTLWNSRLIFIFIWSSRKYNFSISQSNLLLWQTWITRQPVQCDQPMIVPTQTDTGPMGRPDTSFN